MKSIVCILPQCHIAMTATRCQPTSTADCGIHATRKRPGETSAVWLAGCGGFGSFDWSDPTGPIRPELPLRLPTVRLRPDSSPSRTRPNKQPMWGSETEPRSGVAYCPASPGQLPFSDTTEQAAMWGSETEPRSGVARPLPAAHRPRSSPRPSERSRRSSGSSIARTPRRLRCRLRGTWSQRRSPTIADVVRSRLARARSPARPLLGDGARAFSARAPRGRAPCCLRSTCRAPRDARRARGPWASASTRPAVGSRHTRGDR